MPSPFPSMDPYLEDPAFWEGFHDVLITECMYALERELPPGYISNVKERAHVISVEDPAAEVYVPDVGVARRRRPPRGSVGPASPPEPPAGGGAALAIAPVTLPSVDSIEVRDAYIEIQRVPGYELVAVIELLSPWNKHGGGVEVYRDKRASLVARGVHVVELDLLRGGARTRLAEPLPPGDYYAMTFRGDRRPDVDVYAWSLRDRLPLITVPLRPPAPDVPLNLAEAVGAAYDRGRYDRKLRYDQPLGPPLAPAPAPQDAGWADDLLRAAGRRV